MTQSRTCTIAVDFDGTCVEHKFPDVGNDVPGAADTLRELVTNGHRLVLWTMRSDGQQHGDVLSDAVLWFERHGIILWGVNENPEQDWSASPKAYAQVYIDDAALGCPLRESSEMRGRPFVDWAIVRSRLVGMGLIGGAA